MSQREYVVNLLDTLSDEQIAVIVDLITKFNGKPRPPKPDPETRHQSFEYLQLMICRGSIGDREKELPAKYREEKYGNNRQDGCPRLACSLIPIPIIQ
ncbi:MAG: hypothetical protein NC078_05740 [Ruminococcus sp.]|nr:hypothetical protein [Ruminococcus sp.]